MNTNTNTNTNEDASKITCKHENGNLVISGTFKIPAVYLIEGKRNNNKQAAKGTLLDIDVSTLEYMLSYDVKRRMQNAILPKGLGDTSFIAENEELRKATDGAQTNAQVAHDTTIQHIKTICANVGCTWQEACGMLGVDIPEPAPENK